MQNETSQVFDKRKEFLWSHAKQIAIGIGVILLGVIIFTICRLVYLNTHSANVSVRVAPEDSVVRLNGKKFKNMKTSKIKPGHYDVNIKHDGFEEYNSSFDVAKGDTVEVFVCMDNNDGVDYFSNDQEYAQLCFSILHHNEMLDVVEQYSDKIFSITPFHSYDKGFNIDAELNTETGEITVSIEAQSCKPARIEGLNQNALEWLRKAGVNPDDYTIKFTNEGCQ